jgi:hypothetical protein
VAKGKKSVAGQYSLLALIEAEEQRQDQEDLTTIGQFTEMPEYIVVERKWADGDISPDQLERLSHILLGEPETIKRSDTGEKFKYCVETSAVIGTRVWVACRLVCSLGFSNQLFKDEDVD